MTPAYNLIDIQIKNQKTQARPVAWDREIWDGEGNDRSGNPVSPTEFNTTCPFCASLVHFNAEDLYTSLSGIENNVGCDACGAANQPSEVVEENSEDAVEANYTTFRDPIAAGLFGGEVDFSRLEKIDLAKSGEAV